jgi:hypothetical protein
VRGAAAADRSPWAIPPGALTEWLSLSAQIEDAGTVPCRSGDPEAWWPDRKSVDGAAAQGAVEACCGCPAMDACLAYALAADEREGIWGAMLPDERRRGGHVTAA